MSTLKEVGIKLVDNITDAIIEPAVLLIIFAAVVYFFWGLAMFMMNPEDQTTRTEGKSKIIWGLVGFFVMFSVWGIINFGKDTLNLFIDVEYDGSVNGGGGGDDNDSFEENDYGGMGDEEDVKERMGS